MKTTRRDFLLTTTASLTTGASAIAETRIGPSNAMGERVGEVTDRSALVHTRLTKQ